MEIFEERHKKIQRSSVSKRDPFLTNSLIVLDKHEADRSSHNGIQAMFHSFDSRQRLLRAGGPQVSHVYRDRTAHTLDYTDRVSIKRLNCEHCRDIA